ncbi:MAG: D-glycero-beta-D-manno-heptose 1-phosphate adenylyltransferase [Fimbriimonadaceae bacterium]|nr:D-glycero-beta-D-manno-heptose 1-phosphate adenylyltransferase [Fimbriimonadaceae bacterium]
MSTAFDNPEAVKAALLHGFRDLRVLVVGDLMLDMYVRGAVHRVSPEAPVPVVRAADQDPDQDVCLGGAANAALNLARLGVKVELVGCLGDDAPGRSFLARAADEQIGTGAVETVAGRRTTTKTRVLGGGQQVVRVDVEDTSDFENSVYERLSDSLVTALSADKFDAVVLSDYAKGVCAPNLCANLMRTAGLRGVKVYVDPKGVDVEKYRGACLVKPNEAEMSAIARHHGWAEDAVAASVQMAGHLDSRVAVTLGERGIQIDTEGRFASESADQREVFDVSGAGDTVMATLAAASAAGIGWADAARLANLAALQVIREVGTRPVDRARLLVSVISHVRRDSDSKHFALDELVDLREAWRAQGLSVALTNGCFDLLHAGHVKLLESCAKTADRLVVALNSDESITRLKGEGRPLMPEDQRLTVLSALQSIDAVVVFGEDTPINVVKALRPDVLVKGADYTKDRVVGADIVESYGGRVELVPLWEGLSTTRLAAAINKL